MWTERGASRVVAAYVALLLAGVAVFLVIRSYGETLEAPRASTTSAASEPAVTGAADDALRHLLIALTAVIVVGRIVGRAFTLIGQPPVIGEVVGGILLGPSLLGRISPEAYQFILPPEVAPYLGLVAQLGVILYMFLVGLELNSDRLRGNVHTTVAISHASIVVPFVLGSALALPLYPRLSTNTVPFTNFALFLGVAMSITAFPVLARILADRGIIRSELGVLALTCAAVGDGR